ncbi:hypothetical protein N2152v2_003558 [Parachlorella kessleri]
MRASCVISVGQLKHLTELVGARESDPVYGRALVAAASLRKVSWAVQVPASVVITAERAASELLLSTLLEEHPLPAWSVLALWLAEVKWLRGSYLYQLAMEIRGAADASWQELQPLLAAAQQQGLARPDVFTQQSLRWAFSMLLTRLIRLPGLGDTEALVPWADLLNHSCGATTFLNWDAAAEAVVLAADRQYRPGEQVFVSYGQKTSGQLLLSYGFLPAAGSNPHDACLLELTLPESDPALAWKQEALRSHGLAPLQVFPLRMGALPQGLLEFAALASATPTSLAEAQQLATQLFGSSKTGFAGGGTTSLGGSHELHAAALLEVVRRCQAALKGYPSSLESNKAELTRLQQQWPISKAYSPQSGAGGLSPGGMLQQQVLQLVVHEQQVLSRTTFLLQQQLSQLRRR